MADIDAKTFGRKVQAMGDRLFVRVNQNNKDFGMIHIPDNYKEKLDLLVSEVLSVGPMVKARKWELAPGDYVIHVRTCLLRYDGVLGRVGAASRNENLNVSSEFGFIFEKDIIAVVDPGTVVKGAAQYDEGRTGVWSQDK